MTLTGHNAPANSIAYSGNGQYLALSYGPELRSFTGMPCDSAVRVWDVRTGEEVMIQWRPKVNAAAGSAHACSTGQTKSKLSMYKIKLFADRNFARFD